MSTNVVLPSGVRRYAVQPSVAWDEWARHGFAPLEVVVETVVGSGQLLRLAGPARQSWHWRWRFGRWVPISSEKAMAMTARAVRSRQTVPARALLVVRDNPQEVVAKLAWAPEMALGEVLAWLGWPRAHEVERLVSVRERLRARSNDYWVLEAAMEALGLPETSRGLPALPGISVVVSARGAQSVLAGTVGSIIEAAGRLPGGTPWECVVVDEMSQTPLWLPEGLPSQVRLVRAAKRIFRGGARNLGQELSSHPVTVFIDDDLQMAPNYLLEHAVRHLLSPYLVTVSGRMEYLEPTAPTPERLPYGKSGADAGAFRGLGEVSPDEMYRLVQRGDLVVSRPMADIGFPPDYVGRGPEEGTFVAKALARGAFVVPVAGTGVFRRGYRRTGDQEAVQAVQVDCFLANLERQRRHLDAPADGGWAATR
ncbi:glycosyltransferase [Streptomyces sp. CA-250714]|uniref:glycosyltransferase n=1 Tax=Streptomyces sp. CA-250714 TaxID=3240060 RepID=UPI003D8D6A25